MWIRKRIDISWRDLARAALWCLTARRPDFEQSRVADLWSETDSALVCLSVRSGWDLLLQAAAFPPGSEVLVSALTIPGMARIVEHHSLVPVPLDLDPDTALPSPERITACVTPKTRAVLIAHLFGATAPLDEHIAVAKRHRLLFIEDCAQAFRGLGNSGHAQADASLFSFGLIKTATALGGAVAIVRSTDLLAAMVQKQNAYPLQPRIDFVRRIARCIVLKLLSTRIAARGLFLAARITGGDIDRWLNSSTRGFPSSRMLELIRRRPSAPLMRLLRHRLRTYDQSAEQQRTSRARNLVRQVQSAVSCPAAEVDQHVFWVVPVMVDDPARFRRSLLSGGFDSTQADSMGIVTVPESSDHPAPANALEMLDQTVFVPFYPALPVRELERMAAIITANKTKDVKSPR